MDSKDHFIDENLRPLLDNSNNCLAVGDDCEAALNTSGFVVSTGKHTSSAPIARLSLETVVIPVLDITNESTDITSMDNPRYCRICGEGEEKEEEEGNDNDDDDDDDSYGVSEHHDEEALLSSPAIPTTRITQQQPPGSGYFQLMTGYHSSSSSGEGTNNNNAATQHSHEQDPPVRPTRHTRTTTSTTKSHRRRSNNNRKQKNWIQQKNPLIRPCHCKGTMMYVHVSCLNRWRAVSPRSSSCVACDLCGYEYNIYRPRFATIVTNRYFLRIMAALLVLVAILVCAYLCKVVDIYLLGHMPHPGNEEWIRLHGVSWLWMDRFYLFAGLIVISMLGLVYLTYLCVTRPEEVTLLTNHGSTTGGDSGGLSFLCCDQTSCPWYTCYLADFAACSGDSAAGGFLIFVVLISLMAIFFGVFGAVTGIFRLMESWVDSIADHIKEKILDVD
ncbi:hypothetical protein BCR42DRAFT_140752 [Absidia repens]|uniref:RING-CH-type domain-containing protein n=1 Tax=Absidia repens TaxID=90262 RepID=A0A1X2I3S9_9FUNG|nr:hypothetical protein BCR42DRAFT_140752 [Absidia repens]